MTRAYLAWGATALFYLYQYVLRVSPGVMVTELRTEFHMTAEQFASLGAFYLYAYSFLQIPLGVIIDRIGVRKTVLSSVVLCIIGAFLLAYSHALWEVQVSRLLIGAGSACAFMASLKVAADSLPPTKRGLLVGATLTAGTMGALATGKLLVTLLDTVGWRQSILTVAFIGILLFAVLLFLLRLPKQTLSASVSFKLLGSQIAEIAKNRTVMTYAILAIGVYTPLSVLAELWGTAFLMQKYQLSRADAAQTTMMMFLGLAIGSLLLPWICEKWNIVEATIKVCSFALLAVFAYVLFGPNMSIGALTACLIILGILCGSEMVCFTGALRHTTQVNSGMTIGVVNTLNMLGGAVLQQAIGAVLDARWQGALDGNGVRVYQPLDYVVALSILLAVIACCCMMSLTLKPMQTK